MLNKKRKTALKILFSALTINVGLLVYSYLEAKNIRLREFEFSDEKVPESFVGKKIIFISDIHCNTFFSEKDVKKLVERINERKPDIIILGGDNVDNGGKYAKMFFENMRNLKSKYGVYAVLGNHDHWWSAEQSHDYFEEVGFHICDNQSYWINEGNDRIKIGGVGDFWEDEQLIENTVNDVSSDDFCILISHNPDYYEVLDSNKVDLMLSGHTHGGQINLFGLYAPIMPSTFHPEYLQTGQKYLSGWVNTKQTQLYTSTGVGVGSIPFRFFAQPEIVEITLNNK